MAKACIDHARIYHTILNESKEYSTAYQVFVPPIIFGCIHLFKSETDPKHECVEN